ncbi:hypothetical protein [unidentified bacterial endosymbiont]|uniref:hypothetical protein n=1 Tax=unidentified bacterial endosymbiont TaxID=2355 RepID=UPI00209DD42A|nr:hypothetical protein [unidentified bacterial endosymbiont]
MIGPTMQSTRVLSYTEVRDACFAARVTDKVNKDIMTVFNCTPLADDLANEMGKAWKACKENNPNWREEAIALEVKYKDCDILLEKKNMNFPVNIVVFLLRNVIL